MKIITVLIIVCFCLDFFKIGGFNRLPPLLACTDSSVVAAAAELIADICQNNEYCQSKMLDFNVMPELVKLMDAHSDPKVCFKALYALSCKFVSFLIVWGKLNFY